MRQPLGGTDTARHERRFGPLADPAGRPLTARAPNLAILQHVRSRDDSGTHAIRSARRPVAVQSRQVVHRPSWLWPSRWLSQRPPERFNASSTISSENAMALYAPWPTATHVFQFSSPWRHQAVYYRTAARFNAKGNCRIIHRPIRLQPATAVLATGTWIL